MLCANSLLSCLVSAGWCVQGIFAVPLQPCNWGFKLQQRFLSSREQSAAPGPENEDRSMAVRHLSLHGLHPAVHNCTITQLANIQPNIPLFEGRRNEKLLAI